MEPTFSWFVVMCATSRSNHVGITEYSADIYVFINLQECRRGSLTVIVVPTWAAPSEFVSSCIPSWQILTAHAQPFRGARDLAFCLKFPLDLMLVWASSGDSGETARMRRIAWTAAARIGDKKRPNWFSRERVKWKPQVHFFSVYQLGTTTLSTLTLPQIFDVELFDEFLFPSTADMVNATMKAGRLNTRAKYVILLKYSYHYY